MEPEIVIRLVIPRWLTNRWTVAATVLLGSAGLCYAVVPNVFKAGDPLSASKLMEDLNSLDGRIANTVDMTSEQTVLGRKTFSGVTLFKEHVYLNYDGLGGFVVEGTGANSIGMELNNHVTNGRSWAVFTSGPAGAAPLGAFGIFDNTASSTRFVIDAAGNVGIGTSTPAYTLDVNGTIRGNNVAPSDARLKRDVQTIDGALDALTQLRGVRFSWKKDGKQAIGVIAQEVEKVYPELVSTAPDGLKAVDYGKLSAVLIESTKELRAENQALKARLDRIEATVHQQEKR